MSGQHTPWSSIIDDLLDAAFSVLQHDTGPGEIEYDHLRKVLRTKFMAIVKMTPRLICWKR